MQLALAQAEGGGRAEAADFFEHPRRRGQRRVDDLGLLQVERRLVHIALVVLVVEQLRHRADALDEFQRPVLERYFNAVAGERQGRVAAFLDGAGEVARMDLAFVGADQGALFEGAEQQEGVEEAAGLQADADRLERVDVEAAHLDVLHPAVAQRLHRTLAGADHALRADRRVVLVFDLQHIGRQLDPLAIPFGAERRIRFVGRVHGRHQAGDVAFQAVLVRAQAGLGVVLVTEVAHAQAGRVGQVERIVGQGLELVRAAAQEAGGQGRGGAEQVHQEPAVAPEVADHRDVALGLEVAQRMAPFFRDAFAGGH